MDLIKVFLIYLEILGNECLCGYWVDTEVGRQYELSLDVIKVF